MPEGTKTLKVAHVVRRFAFDEWGGTETVVWNTVLRQRAGGIDAEIFATKALAALDQEEKEGVPIRRFGYWYPYFPMPAEVSLVLDKKGGNPFSPKMFEAIRKGGFDLIHIHSGGRIAVQCAKLAHSMGIPCVISLHGGFADVPAGELRKMMAPVRGRFNYGGILDRLLGLRRNAVAESDAVICISRSEEALLKERFPRQRIVYLPNGVDCKAFIEKPSCSPRAEWGIPQGRRLILCISRIDYQKNQKALLELLARHGDAHLLLVGPVTSEWYLGEINGRAKELGVSDRLTIVPGLPPGDSRLKAILHEADLFVLPSLHEPFGIVVLEAWAAGLPVIVSNAGGLKDFVVNGRNGLVFSPEDIESLDMEYVRLTSEDGLRRRLAETALADVQNYSWEAIAARLTALYRTLIEGVNGRNA